PALSPVERPARSRLSASCFAAAGPAAAIAALIGSTAWEPEKIPPNSNTAAAIPAAPSPSTTLRLLTFLLRPRRANGSIDRTETPRGANNASTKGSRPTKGEGMTAGRLVHKRTMVVGALVAATGAIVLAAFLAQ